MKNTKTVSAVFLALLFFLSFLLSPQVIAKTEKSDMNVSYDEGLKVMVMPLNNNVWFWNVGNETIYNFTFSLHLVGGFLGRIDRNVAGKLGAFPVGDLLGINYSSFNNPIGLGIIDLNISISCDNISGIPYTLYHGSIIFRYIFFLNNDWRVLPLPSS